MSDDPTFEPHDDDPPAGTVGEASADDPRRGGDDADGEALADWRQSGKCGACRHFEVDFGAAPVFHGHCKMYPRSGARESSAYACAEYAALPGFADLTRSTDPDANLPTGPSRRARGSVSGTRRRVAGVPRGMRREPRQLGPPRFGHVSPVALGKTTDALAALFGDASSDQGAPSVDQDQLREALVAVVEQHIGIEDVELGDRWDGGRLELHPSDPELKSYEMPLESFFKKIVMLRDRLRVLEAKLNAHDSLDTREKIELQQYISRCYGSLTSFNILFRNKEDKFSSK